MLLIMLVIELIVCVVVMFALLVSCAVLWGGPSPRGPRRR